MPAAHWVQIGRVLITRTCLPQVRYSTVGLLGMRASFHRTEAPLALKSQIHVEATTRRSKIAGNLLSLVPILSGFWNNCLNVHYRDSSLGQNPRTSPAFPPLLSPSTYLIFPFPRSQLCTPSETSRDQMGCDCNPPSHQESDDRQRIQTPGLFPMAYKELDKEPGE